MDNNLYYSVAEKKDPRNPEQEGLYYAHTRTKGVLDTKGLIERIRNRGHCGESGHCGSADNDGGYCDGSAVQRGDSETGGIRVAVAEREQHGMQKQGGIRQQTYHEGEGYIQGGKDTEVRNGYGALQEGGIRGIPPCSGKKCRAWGDFVFLCN